MIDVEYIDEDGNEKLVKEEIIKLWIKVII